MRMVFALVLMVGVALAGAAVYMAQGYISQTQNALAQERAARAKAGPLVEVFVVNKDRNYGEPLTKDDVQKIYWPENALPKDIARDEAALFPEGETEPRFVARSMTKFEPVLMSKVTAPGAPAGLTGQLKTGERAFAIRVDVASGVSGFLQPADYVDVYWTGRAPGQDTDVTQLIEGSLRIVAIDQQSNSDNSGGGAVIARTVTVAASPQQVARLAQAQATGRMALSLVATNAETATAVEVNSNSLLGIKVEEAPAPAPEVAAAKVCTITTRKGAEAQVTEIPCTN